MGEFPGGLVQFDGEVEEGEVEVAFQVEVEAVYGAGEAEPLWLCGGFAGFFVPLGGRGQLLRELH